MVLEPAKVAVHLEAVGFAGDSVRPALRLLIGILLAFAIVAGFVNAVRPLQWRSRNEFAEPIVWVLARRIFVAALFGMLLRGIARLTGEIPESMGIHALILGAFGMKIFGVLPRATLGHTGRPIAASCWTASAFVLADAGTIGQRLI